MTSSPNTADIVTQHPLPTDPPWFSEVPAGQHYTLGRMAELLRESGCIVSVKTADTMDARVEALARHLAIEHALARGDAPTVKKSVADAEWPSWVKHAREYLVASDVVAQAPQPAGDGISELPPCPICNRPGPHVHSHTLWGARVALAARQQDADTMDARVELLPCPFCGGKATLVEWELDAHDSWVECSSCEIMGPAANSANDTWADKSTHEHLREISNAEATAAWNRRAASDAVAQAPHPQFFAVDYTGVICSFGKREDAIKAAQQFAETANGGKPTLTRSALLAAQAPQQPVAWKTPYFETLGDGTLVPIIVWGADAKDADWQPLYASPPREEDVQRLAASAPMELTEAEAALWSRGFEAGEDAALAEAHKTGAFAEAIAAARREALEEVKKFANNVIYTPVSDSAQISTEAGAAYYMAAKIIGAIDALIQSQPLQEGE